MLSNERNLQILYLLINIKEISLNTLTKYLDVSEKTILRSIQNLNNNIYKFNCEIVNEKNIFYLKGDYKNFFKNFYSFKENDVFTTYERQIYILNLITKNKEEKISFAGLAEDIDFPLSTIKKDVDQLNIRLEQLGSSIIFNKKDGIKIEDISHEEIIILLITLINNQIVVRQVNTIIKDMSLKSIFNPYIFRYLNNNWNINLFNIIFRELILLKNKKNLNNSAYEIIYLSLYLTFWLNHKNNISLLNELKNNIIDIENLIKNIFVEKNKKFLLENFLEQIDTDLDLIQKIADEIEYEIENLFSKKIKLNRETINNIKNHLGRNLKNKDLITDDKLVNNFYIEGIAKYVKKFSKIWDITRNTLNKHLGNYNKNDFLTYEIFLYIIVWFDWTIYNYKLKIITVCIGGMGQSSMMQHHVKTIYKNAKIEAKPYAMLTKNDYIESDLIISAIGIEHDKYENILHLSFMSIINNKEIIHKKITNIIYNKLLKENLENE